MKPFPTRRKSTRETNLSEWMTVVPVKNCQAIVNDSHNYVLQLPRSRNPILSSIINLFAKSPYVKIKLDRHGSFLWGQFDGKKNLREICRLLTQKFGKEVEPAEERTVQFIKQLYRFDLVKLYRAQEPS